MARSLLNSPCVGIQSANAVCVCRAIARSIRNAPIGNGLSNRVLAREIQPGHPLSTPQHGHLAVMVGRDIGVRLDGQDRIGLGQPCEPAAKSRRSRTSRHRRGRRHSAGRGGLCWNSEAGTRQRWLGKLRPSARTSVKGRPPGSRGRRPHGSSTISMPSSSQRTMMRRCPGEASSRKRLAFMAMRT